MFSSSHYVDSTLDTIQVLPYPPSSSTRHNITMHDFLQLALVAYDDVGMINCQSNPATSQDAFSNTVTVSQMNSTLISPFSNFSFHLYL